MLRPFHRFSWLRHDILERRGRHAEFILEHIAKAVLRPHFVGLEFADRRRARLVYTMESPACHLHVAIKFVRAAEAGTAQDEFWVSTAYRMGTRSLTRLRNKTTLWRVEDE